MGYFYNYMDCCFNFPVSWKWLGRFKELPTRGATGSLRIGWPFSEPLGLIDLFPEVVNCVAGHQLQKHSPHIITNFFSLMHFTG